MKIYKMSFIYGETKALFTDDDYLKENDITLYDLLLLDELNLFTRELSLRINKEGVITYVFNNNALLIENKTPSIQSVNIAKFTTMGTEISRLMDTTSDITYLKQMGEILKRKLNLDVSIAFNISYSEDGRVRYYRDQLMIL